MLNCVFNVDKTMRVVSNEEMVELLATGLWFENPIDAKKVRNDYEKRILDGEKPRKRKSERKTENV